MEGSADEPQRSSEDPEAGSPTPGKARRLRLELADPWDSVAGEDRPESWGDAGPDERRRLAEFEQNRPPHHI